jgi:4-carboxymuconolactone decarboxylase
VTDPALTGAEVALVRLAAALGSRNVERVRAALESARESARPTEVEEVILQSHLFIGFPDALEAMVLWRAISDSPVPAPSPEEPELWSERGPEVCARVYGDNYRKLRRNVTSLHPDLDRWMVEGGYGRVIGRPGLDLATRELCIAALLTVWNAPRQLHSHLRGAINAGVSPRSLAAAVNLACDEAAPGAASSAGELLARVVKGTGSNGDRYGDTHDGPVPPVRQQK